MPELETSGPSDSYETKDNVIKERNFTGDYLVYYSRSVVTSIIICTSHTELFPFNTVLPMVHNHGFPHDMIQDC
jgi:hypothetical protein